MDPVDPSGDGAPGGRPALRSRRTLLTLTGVAGPAAAGLGIALQGRVGGAAATGAAHSAPPADPVEQAWRQGRPPPIAQGLEFVV